MPRLLFIRRNLANFWYHYKWQAIGGLFGLSVVIFVLVASPGTPKYDLHVMLASTGAVLNEDNEAFAGALEKFIPEDYDGDGEVRANVFTLVFPVNQSGDEIDPRYTTAVYQRFQLEAGTGESMVYFLDAPRFEILKENGFLMDLSALLGTELEEPYGIRLQDTAFYKTPGVRSLDGELFICLRQIEGTTFEGKKDKEEQARRAEATFRNMLNGVQ